MLTNHHKCNITDKVKIANLFDKFFTNVGTSLDSKISRTGIKKCNVPSIVQSLFYEPITSAEVLMQFRQINAFKASGPENVPNKFYKLLAPVIFPYLGNIFNACYESGYFPAILKCAKIIPLHKSGSTVDTQPITTGQFLYYLQYLRFLKNCYMLDLKSSSVEIM